MVAQTAQQREEAKVARLKRELAQAEERLEATRSVPDNQALADALHTEFCHMSHDDQCGWGWEGNDWMQPTHQGYLRQADKALKIADMDTVLKIVSIVNSL